VGGAALRTCPAAAAPTPLDAPIGDTRSPARSSCADSSLAERQRGAAELDAEFAHRGQVPLDAVLSPLFSCGGLFLSLICHGQII
jgi:hypothetical protein